MKKATMHRVIFSRSFIGPVLLFYGISLSTVFADDLESSSEESGKKEAAAKWMREVTDLTKETFKDKKNLKILGITALGAAALMATNGDDEIRSTFDDFGLSDSYGKAGNVLGVSGPILLNLGLYAHGRYNENERSAEVARVLSTALAVDSISTGVMKLAIGRHRPDEGGSSEFDPFTVTNRSFPSGHTSFSFTAATVMAEMYDDKKWVKYTGYSAATFVALARIDDESHWASDVLFGAVKGYVIGKMAARMHSKRTMEGVNIIADVRNGGTYIGLGFQF
jgi:membrane-associated phospholipid phosphatase